MRQIFTYSAAFLFTLTTYAQFDRGGEKISEGLAWGQWDGLAIAQTRRFQKDQEHLKNSHTFIQGSPYYDRTFQKAEVTYYDKIIPQDIYLRYNANTDELEMSSYQHTGETEQMLLPDRELKAKIDGETFYYRPYYSNSKNTEVSNGYFIKLTEGHPYQLYLKKTKVFREAKVAKTSLERSFPARFEEKIEFYTQKDAGILTEIKASKSSLTKVIGKKIVAEIFKITPSYQMSDQEFLIRFFKELNTSK